MSKPLIVHDRTSQTAQLSSGSYLSLQGIHSIHIEQWVKRG